MATAITALANLTLGSAQATVTFSSISGSYRDLILVVTGKTSVAYDVVQIRLNGDTAANYSTVVVANNGAAGYSSTPTGQTKMQFGILGATSTTSAMQWTTHLMDYSATDKHKTVLARTDNATDSSMTEISTNRWASTAAITSIAVIAGTGTWSTGATFALYGVAS
jgi:2-succinyl-5-enolpyruvyl-6-hydroxy-3-cyclohexene-1-carboxylate synthase